MADWIVDKLPVRLPRMVTWALLFGLGLVALILIWISGLSSRSRF